MVNIAKFQTESCCDRLYITWDICQYGYWSYYKYYKGYQYTPVKLQMKKQSVNILPSDHNILISWPDWSQPQVFNDFRKQFSFISTIFFTSPPRIFHTTHFHFPLSTFHVFSHPFSQDVLGWKCHEKRMEHQLEGNSGLIIANNHNLYPLTS